MGESCKCRFFPCRRGKMASPTDMKTPQHSIVEAHLNFVYEC